MLAVRHAGTQALAASSRCCRHVPVRPGATEETEDHGVVAQAPAELGGRCWGAGYSPDGPWLLAEPRQDWAGTGEAAATVPRWGANRAAGSWLDVPSRRWRAKPLREHLKPLDLRVPRPQLGSPGPTRPTRLASRTARLRQRNREGSSTPDLLFNSIA